MNRSIFLIFIPLIFMFLVLVVVSVSLYGANVGDKNSYREVVIYLPDTCTRIEKIEGNKVYLVREPSCVGAQVIIPVKVHIYSSYGDKVKVFLNGKLYREVNVNEDKDLEEVVSKLYHEVFSSFNSTSNNQFFNETFSPGKNLSKEEKEKIEKSLEKVKERISSKEFASEVDMFKEYITKKTGAEKILSYYKDLYSSGKKDEKKESVGVKGSSNKLKLSSDERIYVFVSSSLPSQVLRNYAKAIEHIEGNVFFVLRGGIGGLERIQPTVDWYLNTFKKDATCEFKFEADKVSTCEFYEIPLQLDPYLFRKYKINEVPAVVFVKGFSGDEMIGSYGLVFPDKERAWVSYGDTSLWYHLKRIGLASGRKDLVEFSERFLTY